MATSAPRILQAWMWYVPVLAVNGSMEAYVSSLSSESALGAWSRYALRPNHPAYELIIYPDTSPSHRPSSRPPLSVFIAQVSATRHSYTPTSPTLLHALRTASASHSLRGRRRCAMCYQGALLSLLVQWRIWPSARALHMCWEMLRTRGCFASPLMSPSADASGWPAWLRGGRAITCRRDWDSMGGWDLG